MVEFSQVPRPEGLIEVSSVLDIGAGIRPMGWYKPAKHVCVEPHLPYVDVLEPAGYEVWRMIAREALRMAGSNEFEGIYLLDVIEHMTREDGEEVLHLIRLREPKQIVIATPDGFLEQHGDAWGMAGEHWQEHRSGWTPADFPGWTISYYDNGRGRGFTAVSP